MIPSSTTINSKKVSFEELNESEKRIKMIDSITEFNEESEAKSRTRKLVDYIRTTKPKEIIVILQQHEKVVRMAEHINKQLEIINSYLKRIHEEPSYTLMTYQEKRTEEIICKEKSFDNFIEIIKQSIQVCPEQSFFIYFFPTSQFTLTKIPPKCDLVIQYSYHYEINDQMKNTIINSLNQKPYFIFQCIHPNKFYDDPFVMLNYNDLPLLQNGLIPPSYIQGNCMEEVTKLEGVLITPIFEEYEKMRIFASRTKEYRVIPCQITMKNIINDKGKRITIKGSIKVDNNDIPIVIKQYKQSEYFYNESYLDYLDSIGLLVKASEQYNKYVDMYNSRLKDEKVHRMKRVKCEGSQMFVVTNQMNQGGTLRLKEVKDLIDKKEKMIIEMYHEEAETQIIQAINEEGSGIRDKLGIKSMEVYGGVLSVEAFNHFLWCQSSESVSDLVIMKNVFVILTNNEYTIIKAEVIHSKPSKYYFIQYSDEFDIVKNIFITNHHCQTICTMFKKSEDENRDIDYETNDKYTTQFIH
ncbi:hypothetical protein EDI_100560 [Entamoeba dispar SAW760]|uniref:Uncharacterized protein n=1 Tax=Entamoeba dispar (strain ATCC PRA-260 / SAW760) TaxID=370354 RepID=B0EGV7_ENTDS|nr:uncharacterized protein EDI_100560 [Entamoeba dispar SAW760]EDR26222.1 hypothetical protein EDI_100560 [Entamoeba dispar SAW760]|eukprot:EDR26222.1 hypothetical protein EDI_100560 [Entamoeba dispar SAW760]